MGNDLSISAETVKTEQLLRSNTRTKTIGTLLGGEKMVRSTVDEQLRLPPPEIARFMIRGYWRHHCPLILPYYPPAFPRWGYFR